MEKLLSVIGFVASVVPFFAFLSIWLIELMFYKKNGWNFAIDSRFSGFLLMGESTGDDIGKPIGNKARVLVHCPAVIFGTGIGSFFFAFSFFHGGLNVQ